MKSFYISNKGIVMKIARIVLTATIALSFSATSYSMENEGPKRTICTQAEVKKGHFHDGTKSWFGSGEDTIDKLGQKYGSQEYGPGSDDETESRWANIGRRLNRSSNSERVKLLRAKRFLKLAEERGWNLPQDALMPSQNLVDAENLGIESEKKAKAPAAQNFVWGSKSYNSSNPHTESVSDSSKQESQALITAVITFSDREYPTLQDAAQVPYKKNRYK